MLRIYSPATDALLFEFSYQHWHNVNDSWGYVLCSDVDGDGVDEIAVAAHTDGHDARDAGRVGLCSGRTLRPLYRFYPFGMETCWFGLSMASEGDLNGDGLPDLVVGAPLPRFKQPKGGKVFAFALNDLYL
ncbi:MAG: hypothetical protein EXS13_06415 [Planctomycetes bacterium]|nr:hypothetical protein [Planctomycetota bacterium]